MECYLRPACLEDVDLFYEWVNDPLVRKNSFHTDLIPRENHVSWFEKALGDVNVVIYVLMEGAAPVGQIRFNLDGDVAEIDYSISPQNRGRGLGRKILSLGIDAIKKDRPQVCRVIGQVKPGNKASASCFIENGFAEIFTQFEYSVKE